MVLCYTLRHCAILDQFQGKYNISLMKYAYVLLQPLADCSGWNDVGGPGIHRRRRRRKLLRHCLDTFGEFSFVYFCINGCITLIQVLAFCIPF